jgi:hypothetical protein
LTRPARAAGPQNARQNLAGLKYGDSALTVEWPADYAPLSDSEVLVR